MAHSDHRGGFAGQTRQSVATAQRQQPPGTVIELRQILLDGERTTVDVADHLIAGPARVRAPELALG